MSVLPLPLQILIDAGLVLLALGMLGALANRRARRRSCVRCGCTDQRACRGGCSWASLNPPICSRCI